MKPNMSSVVEELVCAMSALNVPKGREVPPDMVEHAQEHIAAALKILQRASVPQDPHVMQVERPAHWDGWTSAPGCKEEVADAERKLMQDLRLHFVGRPANARTEHEVIAMPDEFFMRMQALGWICPPAGKEQP